LVLYPLLGRASDVTHSAKFCIAGVQRKVQGVPGALLKMLSLSKVKQIIAPYTHYEKYIVQVSHEPVFTGGGIFPAAQEIRFQGGFILVLPILGFPGTRAHGWRD